MRGSFRTILLYVGIVTASVFIAYIAFEVKVRLDLQKHYLEGNYQITAFDKLNSHTRNVKTYEELFAGPFVKVPPDDKEPYIGVSKRNDDSYVWILDNDSKIVFESRAHTNNLGLYSSKNYSVRRRGSEYRIAIIGDSMTAAIQMYPPWPDLLEDYLNTDAALVRKLGKTFKVYNLGIAGAGFPHFEMMVRGQAEALDADLVVINYIESDFPRQISKIRPSGDKISAGNIVFRAGPDNDDVALLNVTCETPPLSLSNGTCRHYFNLYMPPALAKNPEKVRKIKQDIVREYLQGQLWSSLYPYGLMKILGKPVTLHNWRHPELFHVPGPNENEMVDVAVKALQESLHRHPNVLITLHPLYTDLTPKLDEYKLTNKVLSADSSIKIVFMRDRLPAGQAEPEIRSWYCLPYDGHMSAKGGRLYVRAMAGLIKEHLETNGHRKKGKET